MSRFGPAEHHARHFLDGHVDDALDLTVRPVADDLAVVDLRVPQTALGVDGGAVGGAAP